MQCPYSMSNQFHRLYARRDAYWRQPKTPAVGCITSCHCILVACHHHLDSISTCFHHVSGWITILHQPDIRYHFGMVSLINPTHQRYLRPWRPWRPWQPFGTAPSSQPRRSFGKVTVSSTAKFRAPKRTKDCGIGGGGPVSAAAKWFLEIPDENTPKFCLGAPIDQFVDEFKPIAWNRSSFIWRLFDSEQN